MPSDRGATTAIRSFAGRSGGGEHFITVEPACGGDFASQLASVAGQYGELMRAGGFDPGSAVFRRIFLSDIVNQHAVVRQSPLASDAAGPVAVSLVQQPPLPASKVALLAYHVDGDPTLAKRRLSADTIEVAKAGRRHLWTAGLVTGRDRHGVSSHEETETVFKRLIAALAREGGTLEADCVRTWFFVKGVDVFYQDLVDSRNEVFARHGLTHETHYLASTGIEGACGGRYEVVGLDAYSVLGLERRQVSYLNDLELIGATHDYGVAFERATRVAYADRAHSFISGTASIDPAGQVVHPGDVLRQLDRALANVEGLLRSGGAGLADMMHLTVYLRDLADCAPVRAALAERLPGLPVLVVLAPVCRPEWLVEIEGVAIAAQAAPELPTF